MISQMVKEVLPPKEEPEEDSYYLGNSGREYYRFTSKELQNYFIDFFKIEQEKSVYFEVLTTPNEKGMFKVVPSL